MPIKKVILGTVIGGIVLFLWGWASHSLLPFYNNTLLGFTNEDAVVQALIANAPSSGVYFVPYMAQTTGMSDEQKGAAEQAATQRMQQGPFMLASIRLGEMGPIGKYMAIQLITNMLSALFVCLVLIKAKEMGFWSRVILIEWIVLAMFAAQSLPHWNWYAFSTAFTMAELFDLVVGWFFAGLVLAKLNLGQSSPAS